MRINFASLRRRLEAGALAAGTLWVVAVTAGSDTAASAASAAIDHMRDWWNGSDGRVVTMAVPSDGSYGIPEGIVCGMPVICTGNGNYEIVKDIEFTAAGRARLDKTVAELVKESETVAPLIAE